MRYVTIHNSTTGGTATVPSSTAKVLARTGWVPATDPVEHTPDENGSTEPDPTLPDNGDLTSLTEED